MVPSVKLPKNMRKFKKWNTNLTLDTIGSTIGNNISQLVNRFYPQNNESKAAQHPTTSDDCNLPPGVSTISGSYVSDNNSAIGVGGQKDNFGLYALKHDRSNANKKGLQLLHIPLKLHTKNKSGNSSNSNTLRKEINHEKFQSCENRKGKFQERVPSSSLDESIGSMNDCQEVQFDIESDMECRPAKPVVPPRRRKVSQSSETPHSGTVPRPKPSPRLEYQTRRKIEDSKGSVETVSTSLASFVVQNRPVKNEPRPTGAKLEAKLNSKKGHARNKSVDIFVKEEKDVFQDFDNIFPNKNKEGDSQKQVQDTRIPKELPSVQSKKIAPVNQKNRSSSSSSVESSFEDEMTEIRVNPERRFSSTIKVQNFNEQNIPRCKSFVSPQHKISSKRNSVDKAIESESSSNELKSPTIVTNTAKKIPQGILKQRTPSPKDDQPQTSTTQIPPKKPPSLPIKQTEPDGRKFFVYYNDEDELVFNQEYKNLHMTKENECAENYTHNNNNNNMASKNNAPSQPLSLFTSNSLLQQPQKLCLSDFNHNDVIYRNYYNIDQNDSLRSMASSSDGIFI